MIIIRAAACAAAATLGLVLAGCGGPGGDGGTGVTENEIVLGATNALSGPAAGPCAPLSEGSQAWFDHVNANGGVRDRQIRFEVLDDGYVASRAVSNVRTLLGEPVLAVVGACGTTTAAAIADPLDQADVPYLFPYAGLASVVEPAKENVFSLFPLYERQIRPLVPYAFGELGPGSVFTVANQWPGYEDSIAISEEVTTASGGRFLGSLVTPIGTNDYTPAALQIKAADPDYLVVNASATDGAKLVNALVAQDALPTKAILGVATLAQGEFSSAVDEAATDKVIAASPIQLPPADDSECAQALEAAGLERESGHLFGCAVGQATTAALEQADELTREGLLRALGGWQEAEVAPGVLPPVTFTEQDHLGLDSVFVVRMNGREFQTTARCSLDAASGDPCAPVDEAGPTGDAG